MTSRFRLLSFVACALATLVAGCASNPYLESKRYTAAGGGMEREQNAANAQHAAAQATNAQLTASVASNQAQIDANSKRIAELEGDLRKQSTQLDQALRAKRVSQAKHSQLKRELEAIRVETQSVQLENDGARMSKPDPKADNDKRERLQKLEVRKRQLQQQLDVLRAG